MNNNIATFLFVGGTGCIILGLTAFLVYAGKVDGGVFNTLSGALIGGVVGLLAPSPVPPKS